MGDLKKSNKGSNFQWLLSPFMTTLGPFCYNIIIIISFFLCLLGKATLPLSPWCETTCQITQGLQPAAMLSVKLEDVKRWDPNELTCEVENGLSLYPGGSCAMRIVNALDYGFTLTWVSDWVLVIPGLLFNVNISSAKHVAATKRIKTCRRGQEFQLFFRPNVRMGKKCDVSDRGMIVGARQGGLSITKTADLLELTPHLWGSGRSEPRAMAGHVMYVFWFVLIGVDSDGSLLFCCLVVSCVFAYVMHGPNVMSSPFGSFRD